jgi:D-alanine-D-alanine ligase
LVRIDFILMDDQPHLLEINTVPGLTRASIVPQQNRCTGRSLFELFNGMLQMAVAKK